MALKTFTPQREGALVARAQNLPLRRSEHFDSIPGSAWQ
jgi:hypothetical protein